MHTYDEPMQVKTGKDKNKINHINIDLLDDGTFSYNVHSMNSMKRYSYQSVKDLLAAVDDDVSSPHIRDDKDVKKMKKVMGEFKSGKLHSSSGKKVINRKQAIAIGMKKSKDYLA